MGLFRITFLFVGWHLMLIVFTLVPLVTGWSYLERMFLLVLAWWEVCSLMSHQIDLGHLGVTCNLFDVICCDVMAFEASIFLASCLTLLAGNFSKSILLPFMVWTQTLHLSRRTRLYLYARYLQFLVGTWQETLVHVQHCTTHLLTYFLV